jgi:streptomycin 6-kinase
LNFEELEGLQPLSGCSGASVWRAQWRGQAVVVKFPPAGETLRWEVAYLEERAGRGAIRPLIWSQDFGMALLPWVEPGTALRQLSDEEATRVLAGLMQVRVQPSRWDGPSLADWRQSFGQEWGDLPWTAVQRAVRLYQELLDSTRESCLLHGDLHHDNVLRCADEWLLIDPKGVWGDPVFEVAPMLYNPWPWPAELRPGPEVLERRLAILSAVLGYSRRRMLQWGYAQAMLSAVWSAQAGEDFRHPLQCADWLAELAGD